MLRSGCSWRMLPHDLPVWQTVYHYYRCWLRDGTWQQVVDALHIQMPELAQAAVSGTLHHEKPTRYNVVRIHCRIAQHNTPDDEPKKLSSLGNA
jgi:transposase